MREKTHAHRRYEDNVDPAVKSRRLAEIISTFHEAAAKKNKALIGTEQVVLIEGDSSKSKRGITTRLSGKTDGGHKLFIIEEDDHSSSSLSVKKGDLVRVKVESATSASLTGRLL